MCVSVLFHRQILTQHPDDDCTHIPTYRLFFDLFFGRCMSGLLRLLVLLINTLQTGRLTRQLFSNFLYLYKVCTKTLNMEERSNVEHEFHGHKCTLIRVRAFPGGEEHARR